MTGLHQLTDFGVLSITGSGSLALLQGQLTADVNSITEQTGQLAAHCLPNGRVISLFYLAKIADAFYCIMPRDLLPIAQKALQKYAPFFKATLTDVSADWFVYGNEGADVSADYISATIQLPSPPPSNPEKKRQLLLSSHAFNSEGLSALAWHALDIQAGIPRLNATTSGLFLPHELRLPQLGTVSFNKGCYTGQEIIARMQYRGKLKTHLLLATSANLVSLQAGSDIATPDFNATIVDICHANNQTHALCLSQQIQPAFTYNKATFTLTDLSHA